MAFNVNQFRNALAGGGARPNLFAVDIKPPAAVSDSSNGANVIPFLVQTSSLPSLTIGPIEVPYFGRVYKLAGNQTFEDWTTTIINDEDFAVKKYIEEWMEVINGRATNLSSYGTPQDYQANARVIQFGKDGTPIREYAMIGAWPTSLAAVELGWDSNDALETFDVTWAFSWWEDKDLTNDGTFSFSGAIEVPGLGGINVRFDY